MKKTFFAVIILAGFFLISASPSLDGRAIVADGGIFPKGFFAKTVGYLPGDFVRITNPTNGQNIELLVIGALDPSEGVAVLISPEAASAIGIEKGADMLVKITKRTGDADDIANGSALITKNSVAENFPNEVDPEQKKPYVDKSKDFPIVEETQEIPLPKEETEEEAKSEFISADDFSEEENLQKNVFTEKITEEYPQNENAESKTLPKKEYVFEEIPEEKIEKNRNLDEIVIADEIPEEEISAQISVPAFEEIAIEQIPEDAQPTTQTEYEEIILSDIPSDDYKAIVLAPLDTNPPKISEETFENSPNELSLTKNVLFVQNASELAPEKYYIQIAVYNKAENVNSFCNFYGSRYPLTIICATNKNTILVGPLNIDEYGIILQRFKNYGFKDAFAKRAM